VCPRNLRQQMCANWTSSGIGPRPKVRHVWHFEEKIRFIWEIHDVKSWKSCSINFVPPSLCVFCSFHISWPIAQYEKWVHDWRKNDGSLTLWLMANVLILAETAHLVWRKDVLSHEVDYTRASFICLQPHLLRVDITIFRMRRSTIATAQRRNTISLSFFVLIGNYGYPRYGLASYVFPAMTLHIGDCRQDTFQFWAQESGLDSRPKATCRSESILRILPMRYRFR